MQYAELLLLNFLCALGRGKMIGLLFFFLVFVCLSFFGWLSWWISKSFIKNPWRIPIALAIFVLLALSLVVDELVGEKQFEQLCKENSEVKVNRETAAGKTVYLAQMPDEEIKGTWVGVVLKPWRFVDATTGEVVVSYNTLTARSGWFMRRIGLAEGGMPLLFRGYCAPPNQPASAQTFREFGINYIEPPVKH